MTKNNHVASNLPPEQAGASWRGKLYQTFGEALEACIKWAKENPSEAGTEYLYVFKDEKITHPGVRVDKPCVYAGETFVMTFTVRDGR